MISYNDTIMAYFVIQMNMVFLYVNERVKVNLQGAFNTVLTQVLANSAL